MRLWIATVSFRVGETVKPSKQIPVWVLILATALCSSVVGVLFGSTLKTFLRESILSETIVLQSTLNAESRAEDLAQLKDCRADVEAYRNTMQHLLARLGIDTDPTNPDSFVLFLASHSSQNTAMGGPAD